MSRLSRYTQKIFGSSAGTDQIGIFGSLAASAPAFATNPGPGTGGAQSLSNYLTGWFAAILGSNSPAIEDMNALFYIDTYQLAYLMQQGVAEWDSGTTYYTGSIVGSGGVLYVSLTDNNLNHALTDATNWRVASNVASSVKTATYTVTPLDRVIYVNGTFTLTFPSGLTGQVVTVVNTGNTITTLAAAAKFNGSYATIKTGTAGDRATFLWDGSTWRIIDFGFNHSARYTGNGTSQIFGSTADMNFQSIDYDPVGLAIAATPLAYTVQLAGKYRCFGNADFNADSYNNPGTDLSMSISKNGSTIIQPQQGGIISSSGSTYRWRIFAEGTFNLAAGDVITYQPSWSSLALVGNPTTTGIAQRCYAEISFIGF